MLGQSNLRDSNVARGSNSWALSTWRGFVLLVACLLFPIAGLSQSVVISEFSAANTRLIADENRSFEDWIELRNLAPVAINLSGWSLSGDPRKPRQWEFPATNLPAGGHLLVWASGKNRQIPGAPLHTNFKLASTGEYLGLVRPDASIAAEFKPAYPAQFPDVAYGMLTGAARPVFFVKPTPGKANETTAELPGPEIFSVTNSAGALRAAESIALFAKILPVLAPVSKATLHWRVMFQSETNAPMQSESAGVWTATIPAATVRPGEIVRWRVTAEDVAGRKSQYPLFPNPDRTSRYLGDWLPTQKPAGPLPVFQLFLSPREVANADSERGARGCFYFDGEFYDNVLIKLRGNSTAGFPKKSHRLEFPQDHSLRHPGPGSRIGQTSLMAEWGDPSYLRQHLSFWLQTQTGSAAPFHYPVRVDLNGQFWQLAMHSEVLGEDLLSRHGLDPNGALYKAVGTLTPTGDSTGGFEKKTRRREGPQDYVSLARALSESRSLEARRRALYELWNVPAVINYLAVARLTQEDDDIWANMSLYHDCDGTEEWRPIPFDMNVSWGLSFSAGGVNATLDQSRSHPFFGAAGVGSGQGFNRLYDAVVQIPDTREMLLRRMRTVLDQWWQPPGTPVAQRLIENHISKMTNDIWSDAIRDRRKWGNSWNVRGNPQPEIALTAGVQQLIQSFIEPRRQHFYVTHAQTNLSRSVGVRDEDNAGIPAAQPVDAVIDLLDVALCPTNRTHEFITLTNRNRFALDVSGWRLDGKVKFTFAGGTVLPARGSLCVADTVKIFRQLQRESKRPASFVVGNYRGRLSEPTPLELRDPRNRLVSQK